MSRNPPLHAWSSQIPGLLIRIVKQTPLLRFRPRGVLPTYPSPPEVESWIYW